MVVVTLAAGLVALVVKTYYSRKCGYFNVQVSLDFARVTFVEKLFECEHREQKHEVKDRFLTKIGSEW